MGGKAHGVRLSGEERLFVGIFDVYFRAFVEFALADERHGAALRQFVEQWLNDHHSETGATPAPDSLAIRLTATTARPLH